MTSNSFGTRERYYPVIGNDTGKRAPDYSRVARVLGDVELLDEIERGLGEPGYQAALLAEHERRENAR